jgi:hypothetical protein
LTFDPPDAQVLVNGKPLPTDSGRGKVTLQEGKEIKLIVRSPRYTEYNNTLDFAELEDLKGPIRLDHNALYYSDEAQVAIDAGNLDEAVRLYIEHWNLGGRYIPAPQVLALPNGPNCMILGPDPSPTRLAVGMGNGSIAVWTWPLNASSEKPEPYPPILC